MNNNMKKFGLTVLTAFLGGALALGTYKLVENKYNAGMSLDEKQKVYFTNNPLPPSNLSSAGEVDLTQAAAEVTPAVVYIRTTYAAQSNGGQDQMQQLFGDKFGQRIVLLGSQIALCFGVFFFFV